MITIEYSKEGRAISDFEYEQEVNYIKKRIKNDVSPVEYIADKTEEIIIISNSVLVHALRLAIVRGEIDPEQIQFKFKDKTFKANKYGVIMDWPEGFCDIYLYFSKNILRTAMDMRKKERENEAIKKS